MNVQGLSLTEIAALVSEHLRTRGFEVVVVGGSAVTIHAPQVYTSHDIDLAVTSGARRRALQKALEEIDFQASGRGFAHPDTPYTVDFVAETPSIDQHVITDFIEVRTPLGSVRTYRLEDALADRIAAFVHWNDRESLNVAERVVAAVPERLTLERLDRALGMLDARYPGGAERLAFARSRLVARLQPDYNPRG
jgi:hypothetical protein